MIDYAKQRVDGMPLVPPPLPPPPDYPGVGMDMGMLRNLEGFQSSPVQPSPVQGRFGFPMVPYPSLANECGGRLSGRQANCGDLDDGV